jgi:hypothetical protein
METSNMLKTLIILALLLLPSSLSVPLPSTGPWASEAQYFKVMSGGVYHGFLIAFCEGESCWFERDGRKCRF